MTLPNSNAKLEASIEAILYAWGEPLSAAQLAQWLEISEEELSSVMAHMCALWEEEQRGLRILKLGDSYQMVVSQEQHELLGRLVKTKKKGRMSNSAMEVLSIIAYAQPITRIEIDQIRGVRSASSIDLLLERQLIEEAGRLDQIGRPILYVTTPHFLREFDVDSLEALPNYEQWKMALSNLEDQDEPRTTEELVENIMPDNQEARGNEEGFHGEVLSMSSDQNLHVAPSFEHGEAGQNDV